MAIYKVTLDDGTDFLMSADLAEASAPITAKFQEWQGTPYQTADAQHYETRAAKLVNDYFRGADDDSEVESVECISDRSGQYMLAEDADTDHESAEDWYDSYGDHVSTEEHGDISVDVTRYAWTNKGADTEALIREEWPGLTDDEVEGIADMCRKVREAADDVAGALEEAVDAYAKGDVDAVVEALEAARRLESDHGDDPATTQLRKQLLIEIE